MNNFEKNIVSFNKSLFINLYFKKSKDKNVNFSHESNSSSGSTQSQNDDSSSFFDSSLSQQDNSYFLKNHLNSFFRKYNFKKREFFLQKECLDFQLDFYKLISENNFQFDKSKFNISKNEYFTMKRFKTFSPFKVVEVDKNVGLALISFSRYNQLGLDSLNSSDFLKLDDSPLISMVSNISDKLSNLLINDKISSRIFHFLNPSTNFSKLGRFRLLMKLHKSKFSTRPIINCSNHPTEKLSQLIDFIIKPFIVKTVSYLQDSQNLIQCSMNRTFPSNCRLISLDFESLYSNIIHEDAIKLISDFMRDKLNFNKDISSEGFHEILSLVLDNNYFSFNKSFYKQNKGIFMGTKAGPSIANLYLYILESSFLVIHKPLLYKRFIDDVFIIIEYDFNINILINSFKNLKLIITSEGTVIFLDLIIQLCKETKRLLFSVYIKPTNTFSYLLVNSNHKPSIIVNNPLSLFIRIKRICSFFHDFLYFGRKLISQLKTRGYSKNLLYNSFNIVSKIDRSNLIPYKKKQN